MKEVDLGHLFGPYSEAEMTEFFGTDRWLYNPRFILYQGEERKVRAIDDCKRSGLNESFTTVFKLELYDVDTLACLLAALSDSLAKGVVEMDMDDESMCQVAVHPKVMNDNWLGRTLDLSRAYKQLAISPESRSSNVIGYWYKDRWLFSEAMYCRLGPQQQFTASIGCQDPFTTFFASFSGAPVLVSTMIFLQ